MTELFLWCALTGGSFGQNASIIDCFDSYEECVMELPSLECSRCYTHYNKTICPGFGVSSNELAKSE